MRNFTAWRAAGLLPKRGFTLIELLATLMILAIIAFAAAPSFSSMVATQRARNAALDLSAAVSLTRSEAVKRNSTITMAASSAWASGWSVTAGTEKVRSFGPYDGIAITASAGNSLAIGNDGRPATGSLTFQVAPSVSPQPASTICVQVSGTGRIAVVSGACT
ncbi:GspH/FimT family pseudopilin [Cupriavidus basilensis]|uniref:GspH/FimT family pseudopilin n=1 Tax=Cupriavidus basilensis TaxID=68895 RepID=UPI0039F6A1E0